MAVTHNGGAGAQLRFNIVYTPGTVRYFGAFVRSLLRHSDASFCLVSNGCHPAERRVLEQLCSTNPRLECLVLPTESTWSHGLALNYLQARTSDPYFCFMDSDIFAVGEFVSEFSPRGGVEAARFCASPIWVNRRGAVMPSSFRHMSGVFNETDTGLCLGSTYAAVYDNSILTRVMQETGVGFEGYQWPNLPESVCRRIAGLSLAKESYDTGKVLNLLLLAQGASLSNFENAALCHIGGTSYQVEYDNRPKLLRRKLLDGLSGVGLGGFAARIRRHRTLSDYRIRYPDSPKAEWDFQEFQRNRYRNPVRQYALRLIDDLTEGRPAKKVPVLGDPEVDARLRDARDGLVTLFAQAEAGCHTPVA